MFSIIDHYSRRNDDQERVIGALLGRQSPGGTVEITDCFPVPHEESSEVVGVEMEFHKLMLDLHNRVNSREQIVGWYSTTGDIPYNSVLVHEFFQHEVNSATTPVHVTIDPSLSNIDVNSTDDSIPRIPLKAFVSEALSLGDKLLGCQFHEIALTLETTSLEILSKGVGLESAATTGPSPVLSDFDRLHAQFRQILELLTRISEHVTKVVDGKAPADPATMRAIDKALNTIPHIDATQFQNVVDGHVQDLLVLVYLTNLTRAQLAIAERLEVALK